MQFVLVSICFSVFPIYSLASFISSTVYIDPSRYRFDSNVLLQTKYKKQLTKKRGICNIKIACACHDDTVGNRSDPSFSFLSEIESTVRRVSEKYDTATVAGSEEEKEMKTSSPASPTLQIDVTHLPPEEREDFAVARVLQKRLHSFRKNNDCPRCWFQRYHCICSKCPPLENPQIVKGKENGDPVPSLLEKSILPNYDSNDENNTERKILPKRTTNLTMIKRIFVLMHHKEICLAVDTSKLILAAFPKTSRLVIAGIGPQYQNSMKAMVHAMDPNNNRSKCLVLFPTDKAKTFADIIAKEKQQLLLQTEDDQDHEQEGWDLIVIDGTWSQAQKLYRRYIPCESLPGSPQRVQLSSESLSIMAANDNYSKDSLYRAEGFQLRRHPIDWRCISTLEAFRLLLKDMAVVASNSNHHHSNISTTFTDAEQLAFAIQQLKEYQRLSNLAAKKQLGPPRISPLPPPPCN